MTDQYGFIKGALIGGIVGGVAGLLLAPKSGAKLMEDLVGTYESAQKNGYDFVNAIKEKGASLAHLYGEEDEDENHYSFLIGGALGAVVAAIAALLLAPDSGKKFRKVLGRQYDDILEKAEDFASTVGKKGEYAIHEMQDWKDTLVGLITKLSQSPKGKSHKASKIDEILDLAKTGLHLYQQLQSRR